MTIYLNYYKSHKEVDLKEFYKVYDNPRASYKLLQGAPLLVNVEGRYIEANDLPNLIINRCFVPIVNQWLLELRNPSNVNDGEILNFKWRK